jgi:hypothetical protein
MRSLGNPSDSESFFGFRNVQDELSLRNAV